MPRIVRDAEISWDGSPARGGGTLTAASSGAITMDEVVDARHRIVYSALDVRARVPGIDDDALATAVEAADRGCPFSALLRAAGAGIDTTTSLEGGD
jgi:organic hydroperoxide reductase OsmC/OhrA